MSELRTDSTDDQTPKPETHHSTSHGFRVEIRSIGLRPFEMGGVLIGKDWVRLPTVREFQQSVGVDRMGVVRNGAPQSADSLYDALTDTHSYMGAVALAASTLSGDPLGVELRLIEYRRKIDYEVTQTDVLAFPDTIDQMCAFAEARRKERKQP